MGNEREFKIKITGDAGGITTSAEQGRNALGQLAATTRESGKAGEAAGEAVEKHSKHLHGLHQICHTLNEILPGLGALMQQRLKEWQDGGCQGFPPGYPPHD